MTTGSSDWTSTSEKIRWMLSQHGLSHLAGSEGEPLGEHQLAEVIAYLLVERDDLLLVARLERANAQLSGDVKSIAELTTHRQSSSTSHVEATRCVLQEDEDANPYVDLSSSAPRNVVELCQRLGAIHRRREENFSQRVQLLRSALRQLQEHYEKKIALLEGELVEKRSES